jgi:hypothetical protein
MERFVDPVLADLQMEHAQAVREGRAWKRRWVQLAGYIAFAKVFLLCGLFGTRQAWHNWNAEDGRGLSRVVWQTVTVIISVSLLLELPELLRLPDQAPYLLPATLAFSVPIALAIGTTLGMSRRPRSSRLIAAILLIAAVTSIFSLANVGWLTPAANQLYREKTSERVMGARRPVSRGHNELTLTELRQSNEGPYALRAPFAYHARLALAAAPLTFAIFSLVIATRRHLARWAAIIVASAGVVCYFLISISRNTDWGLLPASLAAWLPQILLVMATILIGRLESGDGTSLTRTRA